jgi:RimJ/RimL family protein N-acetyltransferase
MLVNATPAPRPERVVLPGRFVTVVPLDADLHAPPLFEKVSGRENESLWAYMSDGPYYDFATFEGQLRDKAASKDPLFFAILDRAGTATGYASLMRIEPVHRCIEVGHIMYSPGMQRSAGATEAMYLLVRHVFEDLEYRRYEWKCNALNERSRCAASRYGFQFEGVFRQHMIVKGRNRDTAWFSMLDCEWPLRKKSFELWLSPDNFDENGRQRMSLAAMNSNDC